MEEFRRYLVYEPFSGNPQVVYNLTERDVKVIKALEAEGFMVDGFKIEELEIKDIY